MKKFMAMWKTFGAGLCTVFMVGAFALVASCSGDDWDEPVPQPPPPPEPTGSLIGKALVFPEHRPLEGVLHIRAFDNNDVESVVHESSVSISDVGEGIGFEISLPVGQYGIGLAVSEGESIDWDDASTSSLHRTYHCDLGASGAGCNPEGISIVEDGESFINLTLYDSADDRNLFLQPKILNVAHGAGQGERPDFTLVAYEHLQALGPQVIFEADINGSADNIPVVMHDSTLDRKTDYNEINCPDKEPPPDDKHFTHNDCGRISALTFEEILAYDAGYHWSQDGGETFPYREQGLTAVSLEELFQRFPDAHYVIELKPEENDGVGSFTQEDLDTGAEVARLINEYRMTDRVTVASFSDEIIKDFRLQDDAILTAFSEAEALPLMLAVFGGDESYEIPEPAGEFLQIPENYSLNGASLNLVSNDTVNFLSSVFGIGVHVWTINADDAMDRMLDVDNLAGIMTDFPEKLMQKIEARGIVQE